MSSAVEPVDHGTHAFKLIPFSDLHESKHNPRRHFDEAAMKELVDSIRKVGILTPLLVRPNEKGFEIAAGHRRYRASVPANVKVLPCVVRQMDDQTFMEVLTIENLQREDVHPLDEAKGYEALMAAPYKMDVQKIADKVGRSVKYIYDRVKLLALTKELQEFFWNGKISAGHAILLARLTKDQQQRALGTKPEMYTDGGIFVAEQGLPYDSAIDEDDQFKAVSVRELEAWIDDHVRFDRKTIDPMLFPETAVKVQQEVKTLAVDVKKAVVPITYDSMLNDDTRDKGERTYTERSWKRADGLEGSQTCDYAMLGCVVAGAHRGDSFEVCVDKKVCKIHWKNDVKAAEERAKSGPNSAKTRAADDKAAKARKADEERRERDQQKRKHWELVASKIDAVVRERVKKLPATAHGLLADYIVKAVQGYGRRGTSVPRGKTAEDLVRYLGALVLSNRVHDWNAHEQFPPVARAIGADLSMFIKPEVQTSAVKKKGRAA